MLRIVMAFSQILSFQLPLWTSNSLICCSIPVTQCQREWYKMVLLLFATNLMIFVSSSCLSSSHILRYMLSLWQNQFKSLYWMTIFSSYTSSTRPFSSRGTTSYLVVLHTNLLMASSLLNDFSSYITLICLQVFHL